MGATLSEQYGIPLRRLTGNMSPWAVKRLDELGGDISKFKVVKLYSVEAAAGLHRQDRTRRRKQPGHLGLVGKVDIRKLEFFGQNDPDAYSYSGRPQLHDQGLLEFVEMFKAPIKKSIRC